MTLAPPGSHATTGRRYGIDVEQSYITLAYPSSIGFPMTLAHPGSPQLVQWCRFCIE